MSSPLQKLDFPLISKKLFEEQNKIRTNPKSYIPKLENWLSKFRQNTLYLLNENPLRTFEGVSAVKEAINFLSNQRSLPEYEYSKELSQSALDHVNDIGKNGLTTHEGSDNNNLTDRIEKYCEWDGMVAENLDFGFKEGSNIIMNMVVDDGVKERCQRRNMFNKEFKYIGIGVGPHKIFGIGVVIGYAINIRKIQFS